jgi:glycosyltransferase involved in cell wall biosynthesis
MQHAVAPTVSLRKFPALPVPKEGPVGKPRSSLLKGLAVVIPAYNEQLTIGSVVILAKQYTDWVIVVDDGSSDNTALVAETAGAEVIRLDTNAGKAHAMHLGLTRARELGCAAAVMLDADGQHHASDIPRIAAPALEGNADLVIGSRFLGNSGTIPLYRRVGQITLNFFTNMGCSRTVTDSQSGYRALSGRALHHIDFTSAGYNFESDMIAHFAANDLAIKEVSIGVRYDVPNKHKKNPVTHGVGVLSRLVSLISCRRPLLAFGFPGFIFITGGMGAEIWVFAQWFTEGIFHYVLAIGSAFILVLGMLLVIASLILNTLIIVMKENS